MEKTITLKDGTKVKAILTSCMFAADKDGNSYGKELFRVDEKRTMTDYYTFRRSGMDMDVIQQQAKAYEQRIAEGIEESP